MPPGTLATQTWSSGYRFVLPSIHFVIDLIWGLSCMVVSCMVMWVRPQVQHYAGLPAESARIVDIDRLGMNMEATYQGDTIPVRIAYPRREAGRASATALSRQGQCYGAVHQATVLPSAWAGRARMCVCECVCVCVGGGGGGVRVRELACIP